MRTDDRYGYEPKEIWKAIPIKARYGYYEVSTLGSVRHRYQSGLIVPLTVFGVHNKFGDLAACCVKLGKYKTYRVNRLIWESFRGPIPEGMCIIHANGMISDNRLCNLRLTSKRGAQLRTHYAERGKSVRRPVVRINPNTGFVIEYYASIADASRKIHMASKNILRRCEHRVINEFLSDGTIVRFLSELEGEEAI